MRPLAAVFLVVTTLALLTGCERRRGVPVSVPAPGPPTPPIAKLRVFNATAYSIEGTTASGGQAKPGIVAADPTVLPLGTRIRVHDAGPYSGEYTVTDTGREIKGHEIDIYLRDDAEAKRFGKRAVKVEVLETRK
jgi:3D (Asp-Asp-Asp) domain-containing protein